MKHILILLFLSSMFFFSAFFITYSIQNYYTHEKVTKRLTSEIASTFKELDVETKKVAALKIEQKGNFLEFLNKNYKTGFSNRGIEILVYENDSLKFWSDNVFAAPEKPDTEFFTSEIIRNGSGYYLVRHRKIGKQVFIALQLVRYNYEYSNEYLPTGFYKKYSAPLNAKIYMENSENNIYSPEGKFLFSLKYDQPFELSLWLQYLIFSLYVTSFLCLIAAIFRINMFVFVAYRKKWYFILAFFIEVILLRAAQFYFHFPEDLYQIQLFKPALFASSDLLPSLGDLLINAILGVQLAYFAFKQVPAWYSSGHYKYVLGKVSAVMIFLSVIILFYFLIHTISDLVLNSSISFRFENILSLPDISHIGVIIIASLLMSFIFIFELAGWCFFKCFTSKVQYWTITLAVIFLYTAFSYATGHFDGFITSFLLAIYTILYFQRNFNTYQKFSFSRIIPVLIVLSIMATYLVNKAEIEREHEKRRLLATHLSDARDNLAEYYYKEAAKGIVHDALLNGTLSKVNSDASLNEMSKYIKSKYFSGYWNKYIIQITVCQQDKKLSIKPGNIITGCEEYFNEKIDNFMKPVSVPGLYFLRQSVDAMYYLGRIVISKEAGQRSHIFVEISANEIWKGLGYPELLFDSKNTNADNLYGYSYAFYNKGELVKNVGKFSFDIENQSISDSNTENGFFISRGYSHFIFQVDQDTMIVLSKEVPRTSDFISPFSYIILVLVTMLLIINLLKGSLLNRQIGVHTFRLRLQVIMISVIVVSSLVLVTVSLVFINKINTNKNNEILSEKLNSVLVDIESRYKMVYSFDSVRKEELSDLLLNLSNTYFTDINLYNTRGFLLASSRDQIFREGMISEQINPSSAQQLMIKKNSFFIQRENIGTYSFLSAYTPIRNIDNRLLGYLNLPYFARQEEIRREISGLITAFANIYISMIAITVILALLLSRYITKPLQQIGNQFSRIKIGDKNARIKWTRRDEIGRLVDEYNRMIGEMEKSAELLAQSERESAWRQMARQVAHEIKNPLTPIKLSMQLLMLAWNDKAPDWDLRLKRFSQTLIMQIDTLSSIASEFSDFAKMPEPQIQHFDVIPLIQQSVELFREQSDCDITFESDIPECIINSDPNQILRVFNNLIKNAIQAIPVGRQGRLSIKLSISGSNCQISFADNGTGIPTDMQTLIFSPNFTTKTAGMGLGLAMVKNIVDSSSGSIWFNTILGEGTTFTILLPLQQ